MVRGLDLFIEHCKEFSDQYVLIGGAACDLALEEMGVGFRATSGPVSARPCSTFVRIVCFTMSGARSTSSPNIRT